MSVKEAFTLIFLTNIIYGIFIGLWGLYLFTIFRKDEKNKLAKGVGYGCMCTAFGSILMGLVVFVSSLDIQKTPGAINVYRGKTELKITETKIDSEIVKTDSVVIWKN